MYNKTMAKQQSFSLNERSNKVLSDYGNYLKEVSKKIGLPSAEYSANQLLNGALALLDVCNERYNVFTVGKGMELYT